MNDDRIAPLLFEDPVPPPSEKQERITLHRHPTATDNRWEECVPPISGQECQWEHRTATLDAPAPHAEELSGSGPTAQASCSGSDRADRSERAANRQDGPDSTQRDDGPGEKRQHRYTYADGAWSRWFDCCGDTCAYLDESPRTAEHRPPQPQAAPEVEGATQISPGLYVVDKSTSVFAQPAAPDSPQPSAEMGEIEDLTNERDFWKHQTERFRQVLDKTLAQAKADREAIRRVGMLRGQLAMVNGHVMGVVTLIELYDALRGGEADGGAKS